MKYKSVDEIETLSFRDATLIRCIYSEKQEILEFEFDGAVVREDNSANELYTDRYASDMQVRFTEPEIEALLLEVISITMRTMFSRSQYRISLWTGRTMRMC